MIDTHDMSRDFTPRRREPEGGFGREVDMTSAQPFGGGGVRTGQPQPFAPVTPSLPIGGGMTGTAGPLQQGLPPGMTPGAGGGEFPMPGAWGTAQQTYEQLAGGGTPWAPDTEALWAPYQQQAEELSRELSEQAGMGMGTRYGSALGRNIADVGMRAGERFGGQMEQMRMQDLARQQQAQIAGAGGLSGLGGAQAMLPGQLAGQAMGLGGQYQQMQNIPLQAQYQEFMRTQPEYSPYLPYMQQGAQVPYGPQTYQPGFASNMMDLSGMMGMYGMMGG